MSAAAVDVQSFIGKELYPLLFLEDFVFSHNKFSPPASSELELADAVVLLGDVLIVYQIKERSLRQAESPDAPAVCRHAGKDHVAAGAGGIRRGAERSKFR
jgi:hypothetical protein